MKAVPMVYEQGNLRPLEPVVLPEGAHVEVVILDPSMPEDFAVTLDILDRIADMPLEGEDNSEVSQEYESILYPQNAETP